MHMHCVLNPVPSHHHWVHQGGDGGSGSGDCGCASHCDGSCGSS